MMKTLAIALVLMTVMPAHAHDGPKVPPPTPASQAVQDNWGGAGAHFLVSGVAGVVCATHIYPKQSLKAFGCAMLPGLLKETLDSTQKGNHFSKKDLIADAVGAAIGVYTGGLLLSYSERTRTTTVAISIPLK